MKAVRLQRGDHDRQVDNLRYGAETPPRLHFILHFCKNELRTNGHNRPACKNKSVLVVVNKGMQAREQAYQKASGVPRSIECGHLHWRGLEVEITAARAFTLGIPRSTIRLNKGPLRDTPTQLSTVSVFDKALTSAPSD